MFIELLGTLGQIGAGSELQQAGDTSSFSNKRPSSPPSENSHHQPAHQPVALQRSEISHCHLQELLAKAAAEQCTIILLEALPDAVTFWQTGGPLSLHLDDMS